tara:strand:- start:2649 stop:3836 length:1188 start_codon:yes stop_codon:yes gene_type:complete
MPSFSDDVSEVIRKLSDFEKSWLVREVIRVMSMKPGEPCWCGAPKYFQDCHQSKSSKRKLTDAEIRSSLSRIFDNYKYCCADFDSGNCELPIKGAHTVQRGKVLASIAINGHVGTFHRKIEDELRGDGRLRVGVTKQASIFYGFCSCHDTELFKDIENSDFIPTRSNCWASSYRAVCHEFYQKVAAQEGIVWMQQNAENGYQVHEQIVLHHSAMSMRYNLKKGKADAENMKNIYEAAHVDGAYDRLSSYVIEFDSPLQIAVCASISPFYDIDGVKIQNYEDPNIPLQHIAISTVVRDGKACYVLTHVKEHLGAAKYLDGVFARGWGFVKNWLFKSIFAYTENNCFSLAWWDGLADSNKSEIESLARSQNYTRNVVFNGSVGDLVSGEIVLIESVL